MFSMARYYLPVALALLSFAHAAQPIPSLSIASPGGKCRDQGTYHMEKRRKLLNWETAEDLRYHERTAVERVNARLKDEFGGRMVRVRGNAKVMCHLMFGIVALAVDQIVRLAT